MKRMVDEAYGNKKNETVGGAKEDWQIGKQNKTRLCTNYFISYIFFFSCFFLEADQFAAKFRAMPTGLDMDMESRSMSSKPRKKVPDNIKIHMCSGIFSTLKEKSVKATIDRPGFSYATMCLVRE